MVMSEDECPSKYTKHEVQEDYIYGVPYFLRKLNKSLLLLLPWITNNIHVLLTKNSHLFHIGFIISLVKFLEDTVLGKMTVITANNPVLRVNFRHMLNQHFWIS